MPRLCGECVCFSGEYSHFTNQLQPVTSALLQAYTQPHPKWLPLVAVLVTKLFGQTQYVFDSYTTIAENVYSSTLGCAVGAHACSDYGHVQAQQQCFSVLFLTCIFIK